MLFTEVNQYQKL